MTSLLLFLALQAQAASQPFFTDLENFKSRSMSLQTERQTLQATSDQLLSRKLFWTPVLSVSAGKKRLESESLTSEQDSWQAEARLNLFKGGSDWNNMKSAEASNKAQELSVLNETLGVEVKAADLIFKSIYLLEVQKIQEEFLKLKEESRKIVGDRYTQGKIPQQEVTKSDVDLSQQRSKVRQARLDWIENKTEISSLFVEELQTSSWPFNDKVSAKIESEPKQPVAEQKYWESESLRYAWRSEKGGHWPTLDLSVQYQESPIKERTDRQTVGQLVLTLPLWNQYKTAADVSFAYAKFMSAQNDFLQTDQKLKAKSQYLKEKMDTARANLLEAQKNLDKSKSLYQDMLRTFRLGRLSTNDLFQEQNRLLESQTTMAVSQLSYHQTLMEVCALTGKKASECLQ